jgi:ABC-2 type transport system ATP-binding protein
MVRMDNVYLAANNITTSYDKFKITNVNFQLKSGDIMGLVGRSGSGKSTILKTLLGLKKPTSGNIRAFVNNAPVPLRSLIGYSPQENSLFPFLTLEENLLTFARLYGIRGSVARQRIGTLLERLDLKGSRHKRITQLSGGMQKRADLAVTLIHSPRILVLDEPFNGLDVSLQRFIWSLLQELADGGRIAIVSSHMLIDIQKYCNQFGLVDNGKFYNTEQIIRTLHASRSLTLESFLEKLFTKGLIIGE